jgi:RNA polymerase sigma-70 factor, ECF subfamily
MTDGEITQLLRQWREGDAGAGSEVVARLYSELHRMAEIEMVKERPGHTLQPTALVNELYLRLIQGSAVDWRDRAHFMAIATRTLRRILVDHARRQHAARREGIKVTIDERIHGTPSSDRDVLAVDEALTAMAQEHPRPAQAIELRFFGGLQENEIGEATGVSLATVKRDLTFGRAWMLKFISGQASDGQ